MAGQGAPSSWRLILDGPGDPAWNMAMDEALLDSTEAPPTLRLYAWNPPAVSLGRFQDAAEIDPGVLRDLGARLVRRPTGGGAIHHAATELTYSVTARAGEGGIPRAFVASYDVVHRAVALGLARLGVRAVPRGCAGGPPEPPGPWCFDAHTPFDLVAGHLKLVGSAQRRRKGRLLMHGSIPLVPEPCAARSTCLESLAARTVSWKEAAEALAGGFAMAFGAGWSKSGPTALELARAGALAADRYAGPPRPRKVR